MKINSIFWQIALFTVMASLCASCNHKKAAPVVNHNKSVYSKSGGASKNKYAELKNKVSDKRDAAPNKQGEEARSTAPIGRGEEAKTISKIEIEAGDTLYSISKKYQTPLRDLIEANNLSAPYSLKKGMQLIIPKPTYYTVKNGDTLYSVSRDWQMNINDLVTLNDLKQPYKLNAGQLLKVKNSDDKKSAIKKEIASPKQDTTTSQDLAKPAPVIEKILEHKNNKFVWPIKGAIISKFGPKKGGLYNDGVNIKAKEGAPVKASEDGLVAYVGNELKGYGNLIIIKHSGGWITAYAHLSQSKVKRGEKIKKDQTIGNVGATGNVDSPQLYFGLRKGRDAVNPENYLK